MAVMGVETQLAVLASKMDDQSAQLVRVEKRLDRLNMWVLGTFGSIVVSVILALGARSLGL